MVMAYLFDHLSELSDRSVEGSLPHSVDYVLLAACVEIFEKHSLVGLDDTVVMPVSHSISQSAGRAR